MANRMGVLDALKTLGAESLPLFARLLRSVTAKPDWRPHAGVAIVSRSAHCGQEHRTISLMEDTRAFSAVKRLRRLLPEAGRPAAVEYTLPLVLFVGVLTIASVVLAALTIQPPHDPLTLAIAAAVVFATAYGSVRMTEGVDIVWTASVFIHLALAFTFGPLGVVVASVAHATGSAWRIRPGWFRLLFNLANLFLTDLSAWIVFASLTRFSHSPLWGAFSATLAATVVCVVNNGLLAAVIALASGHKARGWTVLRSSVSSVIVYYVGYGWAAFGAVLLYRAGGTVGFTTTLLPIILLQGFLLLLARRIKAQELEREEHTKEREALLQQAIDASDAERKRIASDLHDGVVQTLAGLAFSLAARGSGKMEDPQLLEAADTLRSSVTDLRTLMIEIAPPDLGETGVDGALRKLLEPLPARGIEVELDASAATHLPPDKTSLVFRVAQEAIRNVVNHSQATKVITKLRFVDGTVTLQVDDNGRGFSAADRSRRREEGHVGLHLLNNAVEASSGRLSLTSEPGHGTSLMLTLPC
jgi:signal transduction histidine kinase